MNIWLSIKAAAAKVSVSVDTINRRALEWQDEPVPGRIRFKRLKLGRIPARSGGISSRTLRRC